MSFVYSHKANIFIQVLTDEHAPAKWRVNGADQNSNTFANVFNCPSGSPMNPVAKCELW